MNTVEFLESSVVYCFSLIYIAGVLSFDWVLSSRIISRRFLKLIYL